jgi:flagellin
MASEITLSKGVRQNLLSLQSTAELLGRTQERLSTGKKVNSALDNPINFFTSSSLSARANDLSRLLDSVGNAVQTLQAADKGISAITKLIENAQATARQAKQAAAGDTTYGQITVNATTQSETLADHDGAAIADGSAGGVVYTFDIQINGGAARTVNYTSAASDDFNAVLAGLQADFATELAAAGFTGRLTLTAGAGGNDLRVQAVDADIDFVISNANANSGLTNGTYNSTSLLDRIVAAGGTAGSSTLTVAVNGGSNQVITFGTGSGQVSTLAELDTALAGLTGVTADVTGTALSFVVASSSTQNSLTLTGSTGVTTALGITNGTTNGVASTPTPNATRTSLQADYNTLITQITQLARDASFNGINLLDSDNLTVTFNEDGSSTLTISGVDFTATGLGLSTLTGTEFQTDAGVDAVIADLDTATATLRSQAAKFGSNLSIVEARQDFTKNLINVLQIGSDNLTLADSNEESANMLALQTRQQLSTVALSLAAQADQAVLRLF